MLQEFGQAISRGCQGQHLVLAYFMKSPLPVTVDFMGNCGFMSIGIYDGFGYQWVQVSGSITVLRNNSVSLKHADVLMADMPDTGLILW